jgi:PST family polysaccharide transporter
MQADPPQLPPKSTAYLVTVGTALFMSMRWTLRGIGLISTIILARLLMPADFGLVAIGSSYIGLLDRLTDLSIRSSVIRHGGADREFLDTVFTAQIIRGLIISAIVAASSFVLPQLVNDERLKHVLWALAAGTLWTGFLNPRMALYERALDFRRESILQIVAKLLSTAAAISVAIAFRSYWALIAGSLAGSLARVILSYVLSPCSPRLSLKGWREFLRFAGWLSASTTVDALGHGFDNLIIGGLLSVRATGLYHVGSTLAEMPLGEFLPVVTRTLFPGLLKFKDDIKKLRENALDVVGVLGALSLPIAVGFSFTAPEIVHILYGSKWNEAVPIVQAISLSAGIESLGGTVTTSVAMATGRTELLFRRSFARSLFRIPAFTVGAWLFGLSGAIGGYLAGSVIYATANFGILRSMLVTDYATIAQKLWRAVVAVVTMTIALYAVQEYLAVAAPNLSAALSLTIKVLCGIATYGATRGLIWAITGKPEFVEDRLLVLAAATRTRIRGGT